MEEHLQTLEAHLDKVTFVQFSHNGKLLASASSDSNIIIWKVPKLGSLSLLHTLAGHEHKVLYVSWSPNDKRLLSVSSQESVKMWDVETGACLHTISSYWPHFRPCAWYPDSETFVFGSSRMKNVFKCSFPGDTGFVHVDLAEGILGLTDLAIFPNGNAIIYSTPYGINVQSLIDEERFLPLREEAPVASVAVASDSRRILLNLKNNEIHGWDLNNLHSEPVRFLGHRQENRVIKSCFGGYMDRLIASGSEDTQVYIWQWGCSDPIEVLSGHTSTVNCVSWNPARPRMLASASDDCTIRIWNCQWMTHLRSMTPAYPLWSHER